MPLEIQYVERNIKDVLNYYAEGFGDDRGKVKNYEHFVDPVKGKVIFKLYVEKLSKPKKKKTQ